MTSPNLVQSSYNRKRKGYVMTEQIQWITISQAAERDEVPVSRQTLHAMIKRGDVPPGDWRKITIGGDAYIIQINASTLATLPYRKHGQRGKSKN